MRLDANVHPSAETPAICQKKDGSSSKHHINNLPEQMRFKAKTIRVIQKTKLVARDTINRSSTVAPRSSEILMAAAAGTYGINEYAPAVFLVFAVQVGTLCSSGDLTCAHAIK